MPRSLRALSITLVAVMGLSACGDQKAVDPDPSVATVRVLAGPDPLDEAMAVATVEFLSTRGIAAERHGLESSSGQQLSEALEAENTLVVANSVQLVAADDPEQAMKDTSGDESVDSADQIVNSTSADILSTSEATLRIQPVVTRATAAYHELESADDLHNSVDIDSAVSPATSSQSAEESSLRCEHLQMGTGALSDELVEVAAAELEPCDQGWSESPQSFAGYQQELARLQSEPDALTWLYAPDPAIADLSFRVLESHDYPEGRMLVIGDPESIQASVKEPLHELYQAVSGEELANLSRMVYQARRPAEGLDLDEASAARSWLSSAGLLEASDILDEPSAAPSTL
ncbi:hypothetical protein [Auritidibacter ignavus]|uniref:hypothetical protein n=1 Tax=Auritidibacter ignavus TaxID=678932 RepID=UPI0024B99284|nr:hypothetical protein [Auritidibacter ignavus]WHS28452.1 hypothetical protein QM395_01560 [Auritidibacter ignavus]